MTTKQPALSWRKLAVLGSEHWDFSRADAKIPYT
jgi:hypothetical protein